MNNNQTDWEKNIIDNADSYSIMEWRPLDKSTKTIVKTYEEKVYMQKNYIIKQLKNIQQH